jgi:uronate dehydrogenase
MKRVLVTGAAGALGQVLRGRLPAHLAAQAPAQGWRFRFSDLAEMAPATEAERLSGSEFMRCDLADAAAVFALLEGIDAVVHLGGRSTEGAWGDLVAANLVGAINLYEAARQQRTDRVLFASSNHAVGLYRRSDYIDHAAPARPDSRYGVTKAFGEDLAWLYAHKHRVKSLCLRIGSCVERPHNARMLSTWLSYGDLLRLVTMGLLADYRYDIVYGVSANRRAWWDNRRALELGFRPEDDAEAFAAELNEHVSPSEIAEAFQGGNFAAVEFEGDPHALPSLYR